MKPAQQPAVAPQPSPQPQPTQTSPVRVVGWLVAVFAVIPLTMGARPGEDRVYLVVGLAMAVVGVALVLLGRSRPVAGGGVG